MTSACHVSIAGDGRPMVTMGSVDLSGTRTTMVQVTADQFGLAPDDVIVVMGDTKSVGYSDGAAGSRLARTMAAAVVQASGKAIEELRQRAGRLLQADPAGLDYSRGVFRNPGTAGAAISLAEIMQATLTDGAIITTGVSTKLPFGVEVGAHALDDLHRQEVVDADVIVGLGALVFLGIGRADLAGGLVVEQQGLCVEWIGNRHVVHR